jgi:hypothetical protein
MDRWIIDATLYLFHLVGNSLVDLHVESCERLQLSKKDVITE